MTATAAPPRARRASGIRLAEVMSRLGDEPARHRLFRRWPGLVTPAVAHRLLEASRARLRVDSRVSFLLAQGAATIAARLNDRYILGQSLRAAANALCVSGSIREAVDLHDQAAAAFEQVRDTRELALTLSASIQPLILLGQYTRAQGAAGRARELFMNQGDELRLARLDINVGNLLHRQDRFTEALDCYEEAQARLEALGDKEGLTSAFHNKAVTLTALNRFRQALAAYRAARQLGVERHLPQAVAQTDYNIAWLYYLRGEYTRAIDLLHAAAAFARQTGDAYHAALSQLDLSEIYLELNLSADARAMAEDARAQFRELGMGYEAAKAQVNLAIAAGQDGTLSQAIELFADAREQLVREKNHVWPSLIDLYQAILFFNEGRTFEARRLCVAALEFFTTTTLRTKTALCHLLLARIGFHHGALVHARRECEKALDQLTDADTPTIAYHARLLLGDIETESGDPHRAYALYQVARKALEELRSRLRGEELKIAFVRNKLEVYERLIELCVKGEESPRSREEIFSYVEQAKSRTLLDMMYRPVHALAPSDTVAEGGLEGSIRDLREELNWYYHRIELEQLRPEDPSGPRIEHLQQDVCAREEELGRLLRTAAISDARQAELHLPRIHSIDAIRAALPEDAVLLEYFEVRGRIIACVVDHRGIDVVPLSQTAQIAHHVRLLQFQLSKFRLSPEYLHAFRDSLLHAARYHLRALFTELLAPVRSLLQGRHLLVVPHGCLHFVPFHALFDGERYVVDECSVSYAPSASVYVRCHTQQPVAGNRALVLGIPDTQAPFIEGEVQAVAAALPNSQLFLGREATGEVLRTHGRSSRFVHIASHGYFRPGSPMFSAIRLGDAHMNAHDLYHLSMPAELVTLSGCATGANIAAAGDELLGITRGLFSAGAQALLVSLWDVHDRTTATFMTSLYGRIARGTPTVLALRDAMLELRREYPHPFYWAPFVLTGKFWRS